VAPPPRSYQWRRNGIIVEGATNFSLTFPNVTIDHEGTYSLTISNTAGVVISSNAVLNVIESAPIFSVQPTNQYLVAGSNATFSVVVTGPEPFSLQWQRNELNLAGMTNLILVVTNAQIPDQGLYSVVASNSFGSTTSSNALLKLFDLAESLDATNLVWVTTTDPPWSPQTTMSYDGIAAASTGPVTYPQRSILETTVVGPATLSFWWRHGGYPFSNTQYTFSIDGIFHASNISSFEWRQDMVYLPAGTNLLAWTFTKNLSSGPPGTGYLDQVDFVPGHTPAMIHSAPPDRTVPAGTDVMLSVAGSGTPPLKYQWQFNDANIAGATNTSLTLVNAQTNHDGMYSVVVSNDSGEATAHCRLTVTPSAPFILVHPSNQEMVRGGTASFSVNARGTEPVRYQWQFDNSDVVGSNHATLTLSDVQTSHVGNYRVIVSNEHGTSVSAGANLSLVPTVIVGWGSVFTQPSPNPPPGLTNVTAISAGDNFSVALKDDGTVYAWGWNAFSKLAVPSNLSNVVMVSAGGFHGSALKNDGMVVNWGDPFFDASVVVPNDLSDVVDIAAGGQFNMALRRDATPVVWGSTNAPSGYALDMPSGLSDVVDLAAGSYHAMVLKADGTVTAWGYNNWGQTDLPAGLSGVVAIDAGRAHSVALKTDGTVFGWGDPIVTNVPAALTNVVAVAAGNDHCLALRSDGTVVAWGQNTSGQSEVPSGLTNVVAISAGARHSLALLNDGSPYMTRQPRSRTVWSGQLAEFSVVALGHQPMHYQWQFEGEDILGATNPVLTLAATSDTHSGAYRCVASNSIGTSTSLPAYLTVSNGSPQILLGASGFNDDGGFNLHVSGLTGRGVLILHASTNLVDWLPILTNAPMTHEVIITDPDATNWPQRFYRLQQH
jgi:alpha-tubulin suppressor-like RCC1 family protein